MTKQELDQMLTALVALHHGGYKREARGVLKALEQLYSWGPLMLNIERVEKEAGFVPRGGLKKARTLTKALGKSELRRLSLEHARQIKAWEQVLDD